MATVTLRSVKGSALSFTEMDSNFTALNSDKLENITSESIGDLSDVDLTGNADGYVLVYNSTSGNFEVEAQGAGGIALTDLSVTTAASADTSALAYNNTTGVFTFTPVETADLIGLTDISVSTGAASGDGALSYNNTTGVFTFNPADTSDLLADVVEDTTPQLGGPLDVNGQQITSASNGDVVISPNGTGMVDFNDKEFGNGYLIDYAETVYTGGSTTGTITPDIQDGNVQKITLTGNITFNSISNVLTGTSMTLIIVQPASGGPYTLTSSMLFAGGINTLSTDPDAVDILTVFYDGTNYYASLANDFV